MASHYVTMALNVLSLTSIGVISSAFAAVLTIAILASGVKFIRMEMTPLLRLHQQLNTIYTMTECALATFK